MMEHAQRPRIQVAKFAPLRPRAGCLDAFLDNPEELAVHGKQANGFVTNRREGKSGRGKFSDVKRRRGFLVADSGAR